MYPTLLAASVLVFAAATVIYLRQANASVFHPASFYLAFHGLVFVLRPILGWHYGYDLLYERIGFRPSPSGKAQVLVCTNLGLIVFMVVILATTRRPLRFPDRAKGDDGRGALLRLFAIVAVPLAALSAWSLWWLWDTLGRGIAYAEMDPATGAQRLVGVDGYFFSAGALWVPIAAMTAYLGRFRWWSFIPYAGFAVLQLGTGGRGQFVAATVIIGLLAMYEFRRKWPSALLIAAALAIVPLFHFVQTDRGALVRETLRPGVDDRQEQYRFRTAPLETADLANMEAFELLVWAIPERTKTYDYFANNLELVTGPIPRALWPAKPVGPPIKRFDLFEGLTAHALAYSVPAIGWYNAGYPGVIVWCALFAAIYGMAFRAFARSPQSHLAVMAYAIFLATAPIAFRDGLLQSIARQLLVYGAPIAALAALVWLGRRFAPAETR